ncbi:MAG: 3-phosphoshikimate 1-carboxyvinyltransferase [Oscillospiraceae bacterium]|nr:3-phosphoshikimate 1-carboxyvinyltransferase [Oscillospiraceae bacterium]
MEKQLLPRPIGGSLSAIASKSQAHRLLICAALAEGRTEIRCTETSRDIEATADCLSALGAKITYENGVYSVIPIEKVKKNAVLNCGESGSTLRFLLPVAAALGADATFELHGRLPQRPLSPLWEELECHGCSLSRPTENTLRCRGQLRAGRFSLAGNVSSQFISGLLFALPLLEEASEICLTTGLESASYVDMTLRALKQFGICPEGWTIHPQKGKSSGCYRVEGDWSNAAFWLCAGAISRPVTLHGLDPHSPQGDRKVAAVLRAFGAEIQWENDAVTVRPKPLKGIEIDAKDIPDLVPPLALVAAFAQGKTRIYNAQRLRIKESDRLATVAQTLKALGGEAEITGDGLLISGTGLTGGSADSHNDHRIAMLCAIASSRCPVQLTGAEAVDKSYPRFWEDLENMQKEDQP